MGYPSHQIVCKGMELWLGLEENLKGFDRLIARYFNLLNPNILCLETHLFRLNCS